MMKGSGLAAVAVRSLERGFQGENLSVDGWGLLGDQWIAGITSSSSSSASKMGSSHSWHWPLCPIGRMSISTSKSAKRWVGEQSLAPETIRGYDHPMPTYIWLFKWTEQGAKEAKGSLDRNERGRAMIEKAGGRVIGAWWTQGRYDTVLVAELPDDETASALSIGVGMQGLVRSETMRAYGREEMERILQRLP